MGLGELLDQVRSYYLDRFREAISEQESAGDIRVIVESPYLDSQGNPSREGALNLPMRGDIFVISESEAAKSLQVDTKNMIGFSPLKFEWEQRLSVQLMPFQWNWCPIKLSPAKGIEELGPVVDWFERWFEDRGDGSDDFCGSVHFLSDPETTDAGVKMDIDLGSAPVEAFEELLDSCVAIGASSVSIGTNPESE